MSRPEQWIPVQLDHEQMNLCREMGQNRQGYADKRGLRPYGYASASQHASGYMGELVMSIYSEVPMPSEWTWEADKRRGHDVAGYQVRTSAKPDGGLLIRPTDKDGLFVLILTHQRPVFYIVGWCSLQRAKVLGIWGNAPGGGKVLYVSQTLLTPFPNVRGRFRLKGD